MITTNAIIPSDRVFDAYHHRQRICANCGGEFYPSQEDNQDICEECQPKEEEEGQCNDKATHTPKSN